MAPRAYWRGHIRLSLVSFPVRLHPAIATGEKISLHKYSRETGERIHYMNVTADGEEVPDEDIVKGYEYEKGSYVPIEEDDLERLKLESKHTIELVQFTDSNEIDPMYFEKSYYVVPDGDIAEEAFVTIREALARSGRTALGQVILNNKERLVAIRPFDKGLVMDTLRYNYEVRKADPYFEEIHDKVKIDEDQLALAERLIESKAAPFEPEKFHDHYQEGLMEIIRAKMKGKTPIISDKKKKPAKVVNIMDALKKSLEESQHKKGGGKKRRTVTA
jgi:DNA end-binding protein Ku